MFTYYLVSNLVFYAQSTSTVISGRGNEAEGRVPSVQVVQDGSQDTDRHKDYNPLPTDTHGLHLRRRAASRQEDHSVPRERITQLDNRRLNLKCSPLPPTDAPGGHAIRRGRKKHTHPRLIIMNRADTDVAMDVSVIHS